MDEEFPIFGKIFDIIIVDGKCMFVSVPYLVSNFCRHFNAYDVYPDSSNYVVCQQKDLVDYHVLSLNKSFAHSLSHKSFICLKHSI